MTKLTPEEAEDRKRAVFDSMSARRRNHILKKVGYDRWDPFEEPKDPIDIRRDQSKRTTQMLVREFLQTRSQKEYSNAYGAGVLELCLGLMNDDDRYRGMFEFSCWYRELLEKEGHSR
jgi:hypothetical protein